jgi:hypothetical protein
MPGSVLWTNHLTLLDGTNSFQAWVTNTGLRFSNSTVRTYYMCTPVTVTIGVISNGLVNGVAGAFGKAVQGVNTNLFNKLPYKINAKAIGTGNHFVRWQDGDGNTIPGSTTNLTFIATNGMVINALFAK